VKTIAIASNIGMLVMFCYLVARHGMPQGEDAWFAILMLAVPIINLSALVSIKGKEGWLALFLKRKALEESRKIQLLSRGVSSDSGESDVRATRH
jgi:hypothetical protein